MSINMNMSNYSDDDDYYYHYNRPMPPSLIRKNIGPLIQHLKGYDDYRTKLLYEGWTLEDLVNITRHLASSFNLNTLHRNSKVSLSEQLKLISAVRDIDYDLHLDIRLSDNRMPLYYLCRVRGDHWGEYSLIVEDLYMSPGYPVTDERFIKLMHSGHDVYFLRMSQLRAKTAKMLNADDTTNAEKIDTFIYDIGRYVFQAAWHEDQRLAIMTAKHIGLTSFLQTIELLYLCLSSELCELRGITNENVIKFFEEVYPQPNIRSFLRMLGGLEGGMMNNLPLKAGDLYKKLSVAFSKFLSTEVTWGARKLKIPLWKLLCGNFSRFHIIGNSLRSFPEVTEAAGRLECDAHTIMQKMLNESLDNNLFVNEQKCGI